LVNCGQGLNTDFYAACMRILQRMVYHKIPVGEEPEDLIVLTDMGFDAASTVQNDRYSHPRGTKTTDPWEMQIERIRNEFVKEGERFWGKGNGWKAPRIVIWILRAAYKDFHATADQEGVIQLSGWSPSMLKVLQTKGISVQTPYDGRRAALDDARYDPVRALYDTVRN